VYYTAVATAAAAIAVVSKDAAQLERQ